MPRSRALFAFAAALTVMALPQNPALAAAVETALSSCREQSDEQQRLRCYDAIPLSQASTADRWSGRNGTDSFTFRAQTGSRLLIDHDDAILVGALKDGDGNLLQNLHLAGRGSLRVAIREEGEYTVTLSATGNWRARLADGD